MTARPLILPPSKVRTWGQWSQHRWRLNIDSQAYPYCGSIDERDGRLWCSFWDEDHVARHDHELPFAPGDRFFCQEEWADVLVDEDGYDRRFRADYPDKDWGWQPAETLPEHASRYSGTVTAVRVERACDISEEDARAEGVPMPCRSESFGRPWAMQFKDYWTALHGPDAWEQWVAVPETKHD